MNKWMLQLVVGLSFIVSAQAVNENYQLPWNRAGGVGMAAARVNMDALMSFVAIEKVSQFAPRTLSLKQAFALAWGLSLVNEIKKEVQLCFKPQESQRSLKNLLKAVDHWVKVYCCIYYPVIGATITGLVLTPAVALDAMKFETAAKLTCVVASICYWPFRLIS